MRLDFSNHAQLLTFLLAVALGAAFCLLRDILRTAGHCVPVSSVAVFFGDVLYFALCGFCTFCFFLIFTKGMLRFYVVFGEIIGYIAFRLTLSRLLYALLCRLADILKLTLKLCLKPLKRLKSLLETSFKRISKTKFFGFKPAQFLKQKRKKRQTAKERRDKPQ